MKLKKFLSANSIFIGTIIIISGFIIMFSQVFLDVTATEIMISFFYTISGIIFWAIGVRLNPEGFGFKEVINRGKEIFNFEKEQPIDEESYRKNFERESAIYETIFKENEDIIEIEFENKDEKEKEEEDEEENVLIPETEFC